ncbi:hypothetical protein WMY93_018976 [Mugilogobius chulae]|uniref:Uncharacterized protein n=1 Tax=Mugilogobius chulae TaxID=88201 RepID=A0AAW0NVM9_9GOBI
MWKYEEDPLDFKIRRSSNNNVKIELPPLFSGEDNENFSCWSRQYEVAVRALVAGTGADYEYELARILPTRLAKAAFLLWDSLPAAIQADYSAVKERLQEAFRQRHFLDCFRANLAARRRAPGESLDVFAADVGKLVQEAFPNYGTAAQKEEKFRRFLAGLDPCLRAKCQEQGATDLDEALVIAARCDMARETLRNDYTYPLGDTATNKPAPALVQSISEGRAGSAPWTSDHPPLRQRAYRASPDKREEIDRQVAALLADGVIEESCSPWASPVVLVKKKNGEWRSTWLRRTDRKRRLPRVGAVPVEIYAHGSHQLACNFSTHDGTGSAWAPVAGSWSQTKPTEVPSGPGSCGFPRPCCFQLWSAAGSKEHREGQVMAHAEVAYRDHCRPDDDEV